MKLVFRHVTQRWLCESARVPSHPPRTPVPPSGAPVEAGAPRRARNTVERGRFRHVAVAPAHGQYVTVTLRAANHVVRQHVSGHLTTTTQAAWFRAHLTQGKPGFVPDIVSKNGEQLASLPLTWKQNCSSVLLHSAKVGASTRKRA